MTTKFGRARATSLVVLAAAVAVGDAARAAEPLAEVIVEAPKLRRTTDRSHPLGTPIELASIRYRVSYADLDLATPAGAKLLEQRINDAARRACDDVAASAPLNSVPPPNEPPCVKTAVDGAMIQARAAIGAAARSPAR